MNESDDCARISDILPEFLAGRASAADEESVRAHLQECADCRNRANAVSLLQQTPVPRPDPGRWDYFVKGVVDAAERERQAMMTPRRAMALAVALALIAAVVFLWAGLGGSAGPGAGLDALARDVAELPEVEAAAWTAGLNPTGWLSTDVDVAGLTDAELEQLITEVERT